LYTLGFLPTYFTFPAIACQQPAEDLTQPCLTKNKEEFSLPGAGLLPLCIVFCTIVPKPPANPIGSQQNPNPALKKIAWGRYKKNLRPYNPPKAQHKK
jgi:hypothetical protein